MFLTQNQREKSTVFDYIGTTRVRCNLNLCRKKVSQINMKEIASVPLPLQIMPPPIIVKLQCRSVKLYGSIIFLYSACGQRLQRERLKKYGCKGFYCSEFLLLFSFFYNTIIIKIIFADYIYKHSKLARCNPFFYY